MKTYVVNAELLVEASDQDEALRIASELMGNGEVSTVTPGRSRPSGSTLDFTDVGAIVGGTMDMSKGQPGEGDAGRYRFLFGTNADDAEEVDFDWNVAESEEDLEALVIEMPELGDPRFES